MDVFLADQMIGYFLKLPLVYSPVLAANYSHEYYGKNQNIDINNRESDVNVLLLKLPYLPEHQHISPEANNQIKNDYEDQESDPPLNFPGLFMGVIFYN